MKDIKTLEQEIGNIAGIIVGIMLVFLSISRLDRNRTSNILLGIIGLIHTILRLRIFLKSKKIRKY